MAYAEKSAAELEAADKRLEAQRKREEEEANDTLRTEAEAAKAAADGVEVKVNHDPDFFPTPHTVIEQMLDYLYLAMMERFPGETLFLLEPSAGDGRIVDAIHRRFRSSLEIHCCETSLTAREILSEKGMHLVGDDFMAYNPPPEETYHAVAQNPPFSRNQWKRHILHAYELLKPGGRLVSVAPGHKMRYAHDNGRFSSFVKSLEHWMAFDLPRGAFRESGTDVNAHILVLDRPMEEGPTPEVTQAKLL
jgi:hypothetical protein